MPVRIPAEVKGLELPSQCNPGLSQSPRICTGKPDGPVPEGLEALRQTSKGNGTGQKASEEPQAKMSFFSPSLICLDHKTFGWYPPTSRVCLPSYHLQPLGQTCTDTASAVLHSSARCLIYSDGYITTNNHTHTYDHCLSV